MVGILTSAPSKATLLFAGVVTLLLVCFGALAAIYADVPLPDVPSFLPVILVSTFLIEGMTAYLLLVHFHVFRQPAIGIVAVAYAFSSGAGLLMLAALPGVFGVHGLFGAPLESLSWLLVFWRTGFPLLIIAAAVVHARWGHVVITRAKIGPPLIAACAMPILLIAGLDWLAMRHADLLPALSAASATSGAVSGALGLVTVAINILAPIALLAVTRLRSIFFLWLSVSVFAECIVVLLFQSTSAPDDLGWYAAFGGRLASAVVLLAALLWEVHRLYPVLEDANEELYQASVEDTLTGLYNRRYFNRQLEAELMRSRRLQQPLALLLADLDHFKKVNDQYGHQCGDCCLAAVAGVLRRHLHRPGDFAARYGGEELAVVLSGASMSGAVSIAEQIRREVEELRFPPGGEQAASFCSETCVPGGVRVSLGVAAVDYQHGKEARAEQLVAAADRALYQAKKMGRNRVCAAVTFAA